MKNLKIIISGGGTGGHIFPAIAIADAIKKRFPTAEILFVGAEGRMEMRRVPAAGYKIIGLPVSGFNRKSLLKNIRVLWRLQKSLYKAKKIIKSFKPDAAVGVGGYASGPLLRIASKNGIPILIQEQNSYPGVTNKLLANSADVICVAYEGMDKYFPKEKIVLTGNPCRSRLTSDVAREDAVKFFNLDPAKKIILVTGGSLGSRTLNRSVSRHLSEICDTDVQIIWQAGELFFHDIFLEIQNIRNNNFHISNFIDRMDYAYKAADVVISRAGAGAISELCLLGKPAILVPSPNVAEDHQTKNAMALVEKEAAVMVKDSDAEEQMIPAAFDLLDNPQKMEAL
ncbi:MAG: undecaprenyldiphospho-muramoylpentapeptide beta-N-acetylglucosaminyltransferase, partial [Prevotella sp.]|nr:undecaprenyldiphospho-muramoylpentapeptide beta-N-acetylglucosaminyltransferase [Prevotella sp.]